MSLSSLSASSESTQAVQASPREGWLFFSPTWARAALLSSLCWLTCETLGGLAFLAMGVRLWSYEMAPLFWEITSPVIWGIAFVLMPPLFGWFLEMEARYPLSGHARVVRRLGFLMITGPVVEVLIQELVFKGLFGLRLYHYTILPTFQGSGSWLSPFYYATLYLHFYLLPEVD